MKYLMIALMLVTTNAIAEEVPAYLKDSVITVKLANGKEYKFSGNEYKVVKRGAVKAPQAEVVQSVAQAAPAKERKSIITLHGGVGFEGQTVKESGNYVEVKDRERFVGGVSLHHKFGKRVYGSGTILSNETGLLGIGYGF